MVLVYFFRRGSLPWMGLPESPQKAAQITQIKLTTPIESLCHDAPRMNGWFVYTWLEFA